MAPKETKKDWERRLKKAAQRNNIARKETRFLYLAFD
jgi:hypothetical protein